MDDPPIYDNNARVCSHHFTEQDFVSSVVEGFGPKRATPTLKLDAVPTVFCFSNPANHRKLSEARESRVLHRSVIEDLLKEPTMEPHSSKEPEPATRDIGIQCG